MTKTPKRRHVIYFTLHLNVDPERFDLHTGGVAGPLAAQGSGQICRPFVLGFLKLESLFKA